MADVNAITAYLNNDLYGGLLGRKADQPGLDFWTKAALDNNWTTDQLRDQFTAGAQPELLADSLRNPPATTAYTPTDAPTYTPYTSQPFNFEADPGYQFRKSEGEAALQKRQLASGDFFSGGAMKELADYDSGLASQEYGNAFQRYLGQDAIGFRNNQANNTGEFNRWKTLDDTGYQRAKTADDTDYSRYLDQYNMGKAADDTNWNRLVYLDQSGQNATNAGNVTAQTGATNNGNLMVGAGNAQAGGYINSANGWTNAIGNALYLANKNGTTNA